MGIRGCRVLPWWLQSNIKTAATLDLYPTAANTRLAASSPFQAYISISASPPPPPPPLPPPRLTLPMIMRYFSTHTQTHTHTHTHTL